MRRRSRDERGAALVEMAIAAPLLILLVMGILEFGVVFRDRLTISNASQSAGRVAAALGNQDDADIAVLRAVEQSVGLLNDAGQGTIKHVQIYRARADGQPVTTCAAVGAGGANCNWYRYDISRPCKWEPCPDPDNGSPAAYGGGFTPAVRDVTLDADGLDVVGVRLLFSHTWFTGVIPIDDVVCTPTGTDCWQDEALFRLEPLNFGN